MDYIIKREDFWLCDVPVPKGYPQSQTHVSVKYVDGKYFLSSSPYPSRHLPIWKVYIFVLLRKLTFGKFNMLYLGEWYENPCVYIEEERNENDIPIKFKLLGGCPLMKKPDDVYAAGSYCSDPDLYIEGNSFYVLNRETIKHPNPQFGYTNVYLMKCKVENYICKKEKCELMFENDGEKSPCIIKHRDFYYYFSLDTNSLNDGKPCNSLNIRESKESLWHWGEKRAIKIYKGSYEPWHMSIFAYNEKLYAIIACIKDGIKQRCWQMLGEFNEDITKLKIYQTPLTDYNSYRGAAIVRDDGEFILYNTTVHEKIHGSKAVDGRDVIMAHMPFDKLLDYIQKEETK